MHSRFSERTRYLRYFSPYPRIPARDLRPVRQRRPPRPGGVRRARSATDLIAVGRYERLGAGAPGRRGRVRGRGRPPGPGHRLGAAGAPGRRRPARPASPGSSPRCCRQNRAMLRVFADAGYQVEPRVRRRRGAPDLPDRPDRAARWRCSARREQRTEARSIARLLAPAAIAVYGARARRHRASARPCSRHLRRRRLHRRDRTRCTRARPQWTGCRRTVGGRRRPARSTWRWSRCRRPQLPAVVADAGRGRRARRWWSISAGFAEAGPAGAAAAAGRWWPRPAPHGMRVVGPNCLGIANTDRAVRLNATLAPVLPAARPGRAVLPVRRVRASRCWPRRTSAGSACPASSRPATGPTSPATTCCSTGSDDPRTDVVLLYLETFGNPRKFARIARRLGRDKPVVAVAAPARPAGVGAGRRWTRQALAALFAQSGVIRVDTVAELFDVGDAAGQPAAAGRRPGRRGRQRLRAGRAGRGGRARAGLAVAGRCPRVPTGADAGRPASPPSALPHRPTTAVDAVVVVFAPPLPGQLDVVYDVGRRGRRPRRGQAGGGRRSSARPGRPPGRCATPGCRRSRTRRGGGAGAGPGHPVRRLARASRPASCRTVRCGPAAARAVVDRADGAVRGRCCAAYGIATVADRRRSHPSDEAVAAAARARATRWR